MDVRKRERREEGAVAILIFGLPLLELALAGAAGVLSYLGWHRTTGIATGGWVLALLGSMVALTLAREGLRALRPSVFTLPLLAFLASVGIGLWAAYDPQLAVSKAWLIIAALGLYWALAHQPDATHLTLALGVWVLFILGLTTYFFFTVDWAAAPLKVPALTRLDTVLSPRLSGLAARRINANVIGGMLALLLPFTLPLLAGWRRPMQGLSRPMARGLALMGALALGIGLLGLFATVSRGAWIGLAAAAVLWILGRWLAPLGARRGPIVAALLFAGVLLVMGLGWALMTGRLPAPVTTALRPAVANRLRLITLSTRLAHDTPFTGIGPGMFEMHFSIYALLIHVGYIGHSHNLLLDLIIEQGILGAAAFVTLAVCASCPWLLAAPQSHFGNGNLTTDHWKSLSEAAFASLTVLLVHGVVDSIPYGTGAVLLLFIPFGVLAAGQRAQFAAAPLRRRNIYFTPLILLLILTGLGIGSILGPPGKIGERWRGAWHANLGAVAQARVELRAYDPQRFSELTMDQVRRREDLREVEAYFARALACDPLNATARQRLTTIALARKDYVAALAHMQPLWDAGRRDQVTRHLYGDALVAAGRVDEAVPIVQGLEFAKARLLGQAWSRYHLGADPEREAWARAAAARVEE